jgi:hypothetical protein
LGHRTTGRRIARTALPFDKQRSLFLLFLQEIISGH